MEFLKSSLILAALGFSSISHAASLGNAPLDHLKEEGCDSKLEGLAHSYLKSNEVLVSIYVERPYDRTSWADVPGTRELNIDSLKLCAHQDLDPGSWNLRRQVTFCNKEGDTVTLYTLGHLSCDEEKVLGIKSISMAQ